MAKKDPEPPKSEPDESRSDPEPLKTTSEPDSDKPKKGTPEYDRWIGQRISEGKKAAEERRMSEEEAKNREDTREMAPKSKDPEQKGEKGRTETKLGDAGGLVLGIVLAMLVVFLLWSILRERQKRSAPAPTYAPAGPEPTPVVAPERVSLLEPAPPYALPDESGGTYESVLGPGGKLK